MCKLDQGFTTNGIQGRSFYGSTNNPKSCVKQSGQTLENVF